MIIRPPVTAYAVSLGAVGVAVAIRFLLDPLLGDRLPFISMFVAVVFAAWYGGIGPGLAVLLTSAVATTYFFLSPRYTFAISLPENQYGLVVYLVIGLASIYMIGSLRKAKQRTADQSEFLRITLASIGDGVITTDAAGRVTGMNAVAASLTGWSKEHAIGQLLGDVFCIVNEQTRLAVDNPVTRALREGVVVGLANHTILISKDGTERPIDDNAAPIWHGNGEIIGCVLVFRDVTDRRRHERDVEESEQKFRTLAESIPQLAWMANPDGHIFWYNRRWYEYTGTNFAQMRGWGWQSVHDPRELPEVLERWRSSLATGEPFSMVFPLRDKEGVFRPFLTKVMPIKDEKGTVTRWFGTNTDIGEQKQAEFALALSERELSDFFENATVGLHWVGPDGTILRVNQAELDMLGYSREEYVGRNIADFHVDSDVIGDVMRQLSNGETVANCEARLRCKDGSIRNVLIDSNVLWENGQFIHSRCFTRDITEQKNAEHALRESEALFRTIGEAVPDFLWMSDGSGQPIYQNPAWRQYVGLTIEEIAALGWEAISHPDDLPALRNVWNSAQAEGEAISVEFRTRRYDGTYRWFAGRTVPLKDEAGQIVKWVGTMTDIHERKLAEESLRQKVEELHTLLNTVPIGIFIAHDAECQTITGNAAAHELLRTSQENLSKSAPIGQEPTHFRVYQNGVEVPASQLPVQRAARGEHIRNEELDNVFDDGTVVHTITSAAPLFDKEGRMRGAIASVLDVTDRKRAEAALLQSEQRMRLATEATAVGIWEWNFITGQIKWDAQMFRIYGIRPTQDGLVQYETWSGAVLPEDLPQQEAILHDTIRSLGSGGREFRIRRADDGTCRHIQSVETVRANDLGKAEWVVGTNLDITERKQSEDGLRRLALKLSEADHRKDEFLATLAHELRNPLAPVRNALEVMKRAKDDANLLKQARDTMERQIAQMVRLIDDLLDVSRITRNKLDLKLERVELASIIHHAVEACQPHLERAGHEFNIVLPDELIYLHADPTRLAQVFGNLINNSCKYTKAGGQIWLTAERQGSEVAVTVKDTGVGIPADMLPKVFDLFTQVDRSLERSAGGLGIGLSLVMRLVEMHGGTVTAHSEGAGRGAEFVVRLPVLIELPKGHTQTEPTGELPSTTPCRILIVDDNRDSADSLSLLLEMSGNETRIAHDGVDAVAKAAAFKPAFILLDIGLPKMNGYEACRAIRQLPGGKDMVIVAMTGWGQEEDRRKSKEAGFDEHLVKPLDHAVLMKLLASARDL